MRIEGDSTRPTYDLITYDENGNERTDDPHAGGGLMSDIVLQSIADRPVTDVFLMSHGWMGDVPAAISQYNDWSAAMMRCEKDRAAIKNLRPNFRSYLVGIHWPSLPLGDEEMRPTLESPDAVDVSSMSFSAGEEDPLAKFFDAGLSDSERSRKALGTILETIRGDDVPDSMPWEVEEAYKTLWEEAGLSSDGLAGAPGSDGEGFDPKVMFQQIKDAPDDMDFSFGVGSKAVGAIKAAFAGVLRGISFWKMKQRACDFGESGGRRLINALRERIGEDARIHLMGHSFGCIVMSATVAGKGGNEPLVQPVDSLLLAQGALSLWSYCSDIPKARDVQGYFHSTPRDGKVAGPIVTTQSRFDTAVGKLYPPAVGVAGQVAFANPDPNDLPRYGAVGAYGLHGPGLDIQNQKMLGVDESYGFEGGKIYNLDSDHVINEGKGAAGAHSDIAKAEVGHAFWEAAMTERKG